MNLNFRWIAVASALGLALAGLIIFVGGVIIELLVTRRTDASFDGLTPGIQMALGGLCLSAAMLALLFVLIGWLLARQTRQHGSGYGEAYRLIETMRFREAIPLLERSIAGGKETSDILMLLTSAYAYTGQLAKAQATADRSVQLYPDNPASYITLANGYRLQAAYDAAADVLRKAIELNPDQPVVWAEMGFLHKFAGDEAAALEAFERAASYAMPAVYGVRVYYHLTQAYQQRGDTAAAVRANAKMMSARDGLQAWKDGLSASAGTAYGQALGYELMQIEQALADADAGNLG